MSQASQEYLDELYEKRRKLIGIKSTAFADQAVQTDMESLNAEIARVEQTLNSNSRVRLAGFSKGTDGC